MHPHRSAVGIRTMLALVPIVWAISVAMASPMAIWKRLEYWTDMPMGHLFDNDVGRLVVTDFQILPWKIAGCVFVHFIWVCTPSKSWKNWMHSESEIYASGCAFEKYR